MRVESLGWESLLEEGMATHSSILAWRIPWTEKPGWLQSIGVAKSQTQLKQLGTHARTFQEESGSSFGTSERVDSSITASGCFSPTFSKVPTASLVPELAYILQNL